MGMACAPVTPPADIRAEQDSATEEFLRRYASCSVDGLEPFVGQAATADRIEAIQARSGANTVRIIRPGEPVAMDAQTGRLTIELDRNGAMARFTCV